MSDRYLVKTVSTATPENPTHAGSVVTDYYGKAEELLFSDYRGCRYNNLTPALVKEYGYKRECDARRAYSYTHPENTDYWRTTVEIVKVEIWNDGNGGQYLKY